MVRLLFQQGFENEIESMFCNANFKIDDCFKWKLIRDTRIKSRNVSQQIDYEFWLAEINSNENAIRKWIRNRK